MTLESLFDLQDKLESHINTYWNFWSIVVLGICGWFFGREHPISNYSWAVSFGLVVFFMGNLSVLLPATKLAVAVCDEIRIQSGKTPFASEKLGLALSRPGMKHRLLATVLLHVTVDVVLIVLLWCQACHRP